VYTQSLGSPHQEAAAAPIHTPPVEEAPSAHAEEPILTALEPFIANLADPSGKRYLRTTFEIEVRPAPAVEELKKKSSQIRDSILLILTNKSYDDIRTTTGKAALREEIVAELNKVLSSGKARQIFFKEFIVQ
jgi:flagellar FliL protein